MTDTPSILPDLDLENAEDVRIALNHCRDTLVDGAGQLAQAVKERSDDPLLYALADLVVNSLKLERRIRRLLVNEVAG